jgi:hypothetical protein
MNQPTITLTQQQLDESFKASYWQQAIPYGLEYYIAGRFFVHAQFTPVCELASSRGRDAHQGKSVPR